MDSLKVYGVALLVLLTACASEFDGYFARLVELEGGLANHRGEGVSKYGLSEHANPAVAGRIAYLSKSQIKAIYKRRYYDKLRLAKLPRGLRFLVFDTAVHHGPKRAIRLLQRAVKVSQDGVLGRKTLRAVRAKDPSVIARALLVNRSLIYARSYKFKSFGKGWMNRIFKTSQWTYNDLAEK